MGGVGVVWVVKVEFLGEEIVPGKGRSARCLGSCGSRTLEEVTAW